jgi:tetratricopeptide (TPR) repeat protein
MTADLWSGSSNNGKQSGKQQERASSSYIQEAKAHIRRNNLQEAYRILQAASVMYPHNPFILSYYGSLHAVVGKKYRAGIEHCTRAIAILAGTSAVDEYFVLAEFYLNLGRAYFAAHMPKDAIVAFQKGLRYEKSNTAILKELQACERRAELPVPFLHRSNPINKYFGLVLRRPISKKQ